MGSGYRGTLAQLDPPALARVRKWNIEALGRCKAIATNVVYAVARKRSRGREGISAKRLDCSNSDVGAAQRKHVEAE
jgi:hypothetical protein